MTDDLTHTPTAAFRDYLEDEVATAFRRGRGRRRLRLAALMLASLAMGAAAGLAAAQIGDVPRRDSLLAAASADSALVALRLDLARAAAADASAKARVGLLAPASLVAPEADLRTVEAQAMRARLNLEEIRASSQPPRDELSAPLVHGRDFVLERIQVDLVAAQHQLAAAERSSEETERRVRAGAEGELPGLEAELEVVRARAVFGVLAERRTLRREFLAKATTEAQLARRLRQAELRFDAQVAKQGTQLSAERLALARKRQAVGLVDQIEVLKAELELRERERELQLLAQQLRQLARAELR